MSKLSKADCAKILTALCRKKLVDVGCPVAAFGISESDVNSALEERLGLESALPKLEPQDPVVHDLAVSLVWASWLQIVGQEVKEIDIKSKSKIEERLAFGFTAEELIEACRRAVADPALVKRTSVRAITRPLETDRRVCMLIGKEYVRPTTATWLTPFEQLWLKQYPEGDVPFGVMAKSLSPLVAKHGQEAVLQEAERYLKQTHIAYVSWPKFAQGFGTWSHGPVKTGRAGYAREAVSGI